MGTAGYDVTVSGNSRFIHTAHNRKTKSTLGVLDDYALYKSTHSKLCNALGTLVSREKFSCRGDNCQRNVTDLAGSNGHNGHTGHVPRAPNFFLFEGPPTGCGEIIFFKLIILLLMLLHDRTNTSSAYLANFLQITVQ